jgi:hypothetical protein
MALEQVAERLVAGKGEGKRQKAKGRRETSKRGEN